jgi:flavodoxin
MKVLVSYFSQSGNTEKIAKGIWEEASQANEADLKKLNLSDKQWADMVKQMTGHPNEEDMANAKACVKEVLG